MYNINNSKLVSTTTTNYMTVQALDAAFATAPTAARPAMINPLWAAMNAACSSSLHWPGTGSSGGTSGGNFWDSSR